MDVHMIRKRAWDLREDVVRMIGVGKAGHLGGSCSMAEIAAALYFGVMEYGPEKLADPGRDRFVLSKGHSVLIQYACLVEAGIVPRAEIERTKTLHGMLQGHPDMEATPGIEAVTGSLGQGLSIGLGMALALRLDGSPARVYVAMGDGEMAEGQIWEAAMAAARYKASNLVGVVDRNRIQATGTTAEVFDIPRLAEKWAAFGWNVLEADGHDVPALLRAFAAAAAYRDGPTVVIAHTVKGKGVSFAEDTAAFHNGTLTREQFDMALADIDAGRRAAGAAAQGGRP
jgi:transketolase